MRKNYRKNYHLYSLKVMFTLCVLFSKPIFSQNESSAVQFHGSNVLLGQYSTRQGTNSFQPKEYLRNDLQMSLTVHDIPFATRFYISTDQNDYSKSVDNISFYIDLNTVKMNLARINSKNKMNGKSDVKAPWSLRFLSNFSRIEAGKVRPLYSDLTLSGVSVSGVNIEFTQKIVYAAFATGLLRRETNSNNGLDSSYKQKLMFGKFGFGEKSRTHFYLTYMKIEDEFPATLQNTEDTIINLKPQSNQVFGTELRLSFLKNKWIIDAEAGLSFLTRDTRQTLNYDPDVGQVAQFFLNIVDPNATTSVDKAYSVRTRLTLRTTTISGGYGLVGSGYRTLGNPNLVSDRQTIDGRIDQSFLKRKLTVSAFFQQYKDNLINWKNATTTSTTYGFIARLVFNKAPYLQLSYTPNLQETKGDNLTVQNNLQVFVASSGYNYPIGKLMSSTSITYFNQSMEYERDTINGSGNTQTVSLNEILSFKFPLKLNLNGSYSNINQSDFKRNVLSILLSATHQAKKWNWKNTLGGKYTQSEGISSENKLGVFWDTKFKLWKGGELGLRFTENIFNNIFRIDENYNEFIAQCNLSITW